MINRHNPMSGLLLLAVGFALWLGGCRAFEPEAIIVNKAPETYIIGAPVEGGGGYYRYHVYWYGSDQDGRVERFVWALTDTSVQDEDTVEDEEDQRFNPALDASTLEIGHWTTRTDSVFNFAINQGTDRSADKTLHMVAVDDYGDFDRTPARLYFLSNTLGNPRITFYRVEGDGTRVQLDPSKPDTVGFRQPYQIAWSGETPNIRGYADNESLLAALDPVEPLDGLLGYKWRIEGALGGDCIPSIEDCWQPRRYVEATGDSVSFFGRMTGLDFSNDGTGTGPFKRILPSGRVSIQVNSIDVAGVEVETARRGVEFLVNFDPETRLVIDAPGGTPTPMTPADDDLYPYYIRLNDPNLATDPQHFHFQPGDTIPDRTYVVFKALARDDPRDQALDQNFRIGLAGFYQGVRDNFYGGTFSFASETSALDTMPAWDAGGGWYGDTLGFLTAPRSRFTVKMQAADEHGRLDGTPPELSFYVGFEPELQCIEILPKPGTSAYPADWPGVTDPENPGDGNACFADTTELTITSAGLGATDLQKGTAVSLLVDKATGYLRFVDPSAVTVGDRDANYVEDGDRYTMTVLLHGQDHVAERWAQPLRRMGGWRYEVSNICDPYNEVRDGGGNDDIREPTWGEPGGRLNLEIDRSSGLWKVTVQVGVPRSLLQLGPDIYRLILAGQYGPEAADLIFDSVTRQLGVGWVDAVALDQTQECQSPVRPAKFNLFSAVRPPVRNLPAGTWRDCVLPSAIPASALKTSLGLGQHAMESLGGRPVRKYFRLTLVTDLGQRFVCTGP